MEPISILILNFINCQFCFTLNIYPDLTYISNIYRSENHIIGSLLLEIKSTYFYIEFDLSIPISHYLYLLFLVLKPNIKYYDYKLFLSQNDNLTYNSSCKSR